MPLLPLEHFRRILAYNPWHFFGLQSTGANQAHIHSECNNLVYQSAWQNANAAGRNEVLSAIQSAEDRLFDYLYYRPAPHYVVETRPWPRASGWRFSPVDALGRWVGVVTGEKYIQAVGVETRAAIGLVQAVAYSDLDGDGLNDLATITVAVGAVTDPDQIEVYFNTADRYDGTTIPATGAPDVIEDALRWRIQPMRVKIAGGIATITGPAWVFVKPVLYEAGAPLDPATAANFASTVDIYRRYTDPDGITTDTSQAVLIWETTPCGGGWWCGCDGGATYTTNSSDPAALAYAIARAGIRDATNGEIAPGPAVYNTTAAVFATTHFATGFEPDRVLLRYRAGVALESGQMARRWQTIVARMAMAELPERLAACDVANKELWRWQFDLARSAGSNDEAYGAVSARDLENPFGTRRGHVFAWRAIQQLMTATGLLM